MSHFRYIRRQQLEIEDDSDNKETVKLAKQDNRCYWIWKYLVLAILVFAIIYTIKTGRMDLGWLGVWFFKLMRE